MSVATPEVRPSLYVESSQARKDEFWLFRPWARRLGAAAGALLGGAFATAYIPSNPVHAEVQNYIYPDRSSELKAPQDEKAVLYEADMSEWPVDQRECARNYFDQEAVEYHMEITCEGSLRAVTLGPNFADFDLTVDTRGAFEGNIPLYGIFILDGAEEEFQAYHFFWINGEGFSRYDILLRSPLGLGSLPGGEPPTSSPAIATDGDPNIIRLIKQDSNVKFIVNDETLIDRSILLREGREVKIGVAVGTSIDFQEDGYADIAFSNLLVMEP